MTQSAHVRLGRATPLASTTNVPIASIGSVGDPLDQRGLDRGMRACPWPIGRTAVGDARRRNTPRRVRAAFPHHRVRRAVQLNQHLVRHRRRQRVVDRGRVAGAARSVSSSPCMTSVGEISCAATSVLHPHAEKVGERRTGVVDHGGRTGVSRRPDVRVAAVMAPPEPLVERQEGCPFGTRRSSADGQNRRHRHNYCCRVAQDRLRHSRYLPSGFDCVPSTLGN